MSTTPYFNFTKIADSKPADVVTDLNGLADQVDTTLHNELTRVNTAHLDLLEMVVTLYEMNGVG